MNDGSQMGSQGTDDGWNLMAEILSEEDVGIGMLGDQLLVYVRSRDPHDPPSFRFQNAGYHVDELDSSHPPDPCHRSGRAIEGECTDTNVQISRILITAAAAVFHEGAMRRRG